jgi:hypothetical protein
MAVVVRAVMLTLCPDVKPDPDPDPDPGPDFFLILILISSRF